MDLIEGAKRNRYVVPAYVIALYNILFVGSRNAALGLVVVEVAVLIYLLFRLDIERYLCWFLIFLASSVEFQVLVSNDVTDTIFNFKNFRLFGLSLGLLFVLLPSFVVFLELVRTRGIVAWRKRTPIRTVLWLLILLLVDGIVIGSVNLLVNDNGIQGIPNYIAVFVGEVYLGAWPVLLFALAYFALIRSRRRGKELESALIATLLANCTAPFLPALFGVQGSYGDFKYMLASSAALFSPFVALLPAYSQYRRQAMLFLTAFAVGAVLPMMLFSFVSGKTLIIMLVVPPVFALVRLRNAATFGRTVALALGLGAILFMAINYSSKQTGTLFDSKFKEVVGLSGLVSSDWVSTMKPSSRFRVFEAINVWAEYRNSPSKVLFGKGFMGSVRDYVGGFGWKVSGTFPLEQYDNETFYSLHEVFGYLLKYGLVGVVVWGVLLRITIARFADNPWLLLGTFWFVLLFGFSQTISVVGVLSLAYGTYLLERDDGEAKDAIGCGDERHAIADAR